MKHTTVNSTLVKDNTIFLIVSSITSNGNNWHLSTWQISAMNIFAWFSINHWFLRIMQNMCHCIHSVQIGSRKYTHCLLTHSTLIQVSRCRIVIRTRNITSKYSQHHRWMNFTMSVFEIRIVVFLVNQQIVF